MEDTKGYRLLDPETNKVFKSRDVVFFEEGEFERLNDIHLSELLIDEEGDTSSLSIDDETPIASSQSRKVNLSPLTNDSTTEDDFYEEDIPYYSLDDEEEYRKPAHIEVNPNVITQTPRRSYRQIKPRKLDDYILYNALELSMNDPTTVKKICSDTEGGKWKIAMKEEYDSLMKNKTWDLHDLADKKTLNCK